MLVLRFPTGRNKASLCLVPVWPVWAESYIIEVVFWLFLSKTRHAFQTTAFTELVKGLPAVLYTSQRVDKHWPSIARGQCVGIARVFLSILHDIILPTSMCHNCIPRQVTLPVLFPVAPQREQTNEKANMQMSWNSPRAVFSNFRDYRNAAS